MHLRCYPNACPSRPWSKAAGRNQASGFRLPVFFDRAASGASSSSSRDEDTGAGVTEPRSRTSDSDSGSRTQEPELDSPCNCK